jgi:hypothetical protein
MKKLFVGTLAVALLINGAFAQINPDVLPKHKREAKIRKPRHSNPVTPAQPVLPKGPYPDDPSAPRNEPPDRVKHWGREVKHTPDEPKILKVRKQKREPAPVGVG